MTTTALTRQRLLPNYVGGLLFQLAAVNRDLAEAATVEYPFAKGIGRKWRFDLAFPDYMVAVEVDGGAFSGGRHVRGAGFEKDLEKLNAAVELGWRVLRFTPRMVEDGSALAVLERVLGVA